MRSAILFLSLVFLVSCDNFGNLTDQEYVDRAQEFLDKGELNSATLELKNALSQNSNNSQARWLLGNTYLELGNGPAAEKELRRARELGVSDEAIILPLSNALLLQGKFSDIISETQPLDSMTPENRARVHSLRGNAFLGQGKFDDAANEFQSAIALSGNLAEAQIGHARIAFILRKDEEARNWINKAIEGTPESADAWSLLGDIEIREGNAAEAETAFSNAIKFRKYASMDITKRALARIRLEKYPDVKADIETLEQGGFKDHPYVQYVKGRYYYSEAKYREAAEAFQSSHTKNPSFLLATFYLASTQYFLGNLEQARSLTKNLQASAPKSLPAKRLLGAIEIERSEFGAAKDLLQEALRKTPDDLVILQMLATSSLLEGDLEQSIEYIEQILSLEPESSQAKEMLIMTKLVQGQALDENLVEGIGEASPEGRDYSQAFIYALAAFRDKKFDQALLQAQKLHQRYPDNIDPLNLMAACYLAQGQRDKARIELEKVLALKPNEPSAARNLAIVEAQEGKLKQAQTRVSKLVKAYPQDEKAILLLAEIEVLQGNQAAAVQVLEQALERNPDALSVRVQLAGHYLSTGQIARVIEVTDGLNDKQFQQQPSLLELRGKAQMRWGSLESARGTFKRWSELAPDSALAHLMYGDSLARSGKQDLAAEELKRAIELDPKAEPARVAEIKMLVHFEKIDSAREALTQLRQDFGPSTAVLGIEGWFALGTRDYATAADRFAAVLKQKPDTDIVISLVRALWAQQKHDEAIEVMRDWLKAQPQDIVVRLQLAASYLALNREEEAIEVYTDVLKTDPNQLLALNNLAWLNRNRNIDRAFSYVEHAYQLAPQDPYVLDTYGMLLLSMGDHIQGTRLIRQAAELLPNNVEMQLHLARALVQQELVSEAKDVLNGLLEKEPNSQAATEAKELLRSLAR